MKTLFNPSDLSNCMYFSMGYFNTLSLAYLVSKIILIHAASVVVSVLRILVFQIAFVSYCSSSPIKLFAQIATMRATNSSWISTTNSTSLLIRPQRRTNSLYTRFIFVHNWCGKSLVNLLESEMISDTQAELVIVPKMLRERMHGWSCIQKAS